jgi:hypothetical protein
MQSAWCFNGGATERGRYVQTLLEHCTTVAAASGGVLGFGKVSIRERVWTTSAVRCNRRQLHSSTELSKRRPFRGHMAAPRASMAAILVRAWTIDDSQPP